MSRFNVLLTVFSSLPFKQILNRASLRVKLILKCFVTLDSDILSKAFCAYQVRTGFLNSSYKTTVKDQDDSLTFDELVNLVQPSELLHLTHQHNRANCIVLWIEYENYFYHTVVRCYVLEVRYHFPVTY